MGFDPLDDLEDFLEDLLERFFEPPRRRGERSRKPRGDKDGNRPLTPARLARSLGFSDRRGWVCSGTVEGRKLSLRVAEPSDSEAAGWLAVDVPLRAALPEGLRITDEVSGRRLFSGGYTELLRVEARREEEAQVIRDDPAVRKLMHRLVPRKKWMFRLDVRERRLRAAFPRATSEDAAKGKIVDIARLATAIERALMGGWIELASRLDATLYADALSIEGHVGEVAVQVQHHPDPPARTTVVAKVAPPLPAGTEVGHPDHHEDALDLNDPILDPLLALVSSDRDALADRLCRDAVRGPLLELVHDHPGSLLLEDQVHLVSPGLILQPGPAVELVAELARALGSSRSSNPG